MPINRLSVLYLWLVFLKDYLTVFVYNTEICLLLYFQFVAHIYLAAAAASVPTRKLKLNFVERG